MRFQLSHPCQTSGWTLVGSQSNHIETLLWLRVNGAELAETTPEDFIAQSLSAKERASGAVFLTSAILGDYAEVLSEKEDYWVRCIATVGLGNALRAGDPAQYAGIGTINIACELSHPVSENGRLEGLTVIAEAKTLAVYEENILSSLSGERSSGTGTDCSLICSPQKSQGQVEYLGKHTILGELIGKSTYQAVHQGIRVWKQRNPNSPLIGGSPWES